MRKFLSILLSLLILTSCISVVFGIHASGTTDELTSDEFASEVAALIESSDISGNLPSKNNFDCNNCNHADFENCRLIVKSSSKIDTLDAVSVINGYNDLWILQFSSPHETNEAYSYYSTRAGIDFVEPDKKVVLSESEPEYVSPIADEEKEYLSWGPSFIGLDVFNKTLLESESELEEIVVGVVDSGADPNHPLLKGRVIPTKINTSSSGIRNDSMDDLGHGTQVSGIIADSTIDNVIIKPYKVIDFRGNGSVITVAAGLNCAIDDEVDVINISIGFKEDSEVLKAAVQRAEEHDIVVVGASGNDGSESLYYPASYSSVIKVTAVNELGVLTNFSTHGNGVDFAAPGINIVTSTLNNKTVKVKGTSFSAPFVSAVAACILCVHNGATPEDVEHIIAEYSFDPGDFNSEKKYGKGIVKIPPYAGDVMQAEKTSTPYFSLKNSFYLNEIDIEIFCDTPNATIYYTTDRTVPSKNNPSAKIYDGNPLHFSQTVVLMAVAYSDGNYRSSVGSFQSIIAPYPALEDISIDSDGTILGYSGSLTSITIPEQINGITVTSVGKDSFKDSSITELILPNTVTSIGDSAFENCKNLRTVYGKNITKIGNRAFYDCVRFKNPFFGELSSIGNYSFYNVCSKEFEVYGISFELKLKKLNRIPEGAFMESAISSVELGNIYSIGKNAFSECQALTSIYADLIDTVPDGAFKGLSNLVTAEINNLTYVPTSLFSICENLLSISIPNASFINSNAFEGCSSLVAVNLPAAETVYSNAFSGCSSLRTLNLPSMKSFDEEVYISNKPLILLPENLETFRAEKMTRTVMDMFTKARNIKNIYFNSVTEIAEYTFRGCHNIFFLNIESAVTVKENALTYCTIEFIDARSLESTADLPDNSGILLSNNFYESTDNAENLTIYGTPDTFVERYALKKGYNFIPIPMIYNELPDYVTENSETLYINAIGFNLKYQWYSNTVKSTQGGTPIPDATMSYYTFTGNDKSPYYYCEITQTDLNKVSVITTNIITKDTNPADYTEYNKAVNEANAIIRNHYENIYLLDEALSVNVDDMFSCEQHIVDAQTQAIRDAIAALKFKGVKKIVLHASKTELNIFESVRIIPSITPVDAIYDKIEWYTDSDDIIIISKNGNVRCIGDGIATVYAKVINADGTETVGSITIYCDLDEVEKVFGFIFGSYYKILLKLYSFSI